jgi:hypothetical protein
MPICTAAAGVAAKIAASAATPTQRFIFASPNSLEKGPRKIVLQSPSQISRRAQGSGLPDGAEKAAMGERGARTLGWEEPRVSVTNQGG